MTIGDNNLLFWATLYIYIHDYPQKVSSLPNHQQLALNPSKSCQ